MTPAAEARAPRAQVVERIVKAGAVAVLRLSSARDVVNVCTALDAGGVHVVEMTMTTPGALKAVRALRDAFGDRMLVGAGSVLNTEDAMHAIAAGAQFLVSPVFDGGVLRAAVASDVPSIPGAFTPTEILAAHRAGADVVKVFPADALGPAFLKGVLGPMPFLRLMPTGGVTPENVGTWLRAGAVAVGLGSALVDPKLVAAGNVDGILERARTVANAVTAFHRERDLS